MNEKKILIVEDDVHIAELLNINLVKAGYSIVLAQDAVQAVSVAQNERPDLIILDIALPAGGGASVLDALTKSSKTSLVPIVVISALPEDEILRRVPSFIGNIESGRIIHFAPKPLDIPMVLKKIKNRLDSLPNAPITKGKPK